MIVLKEVVFVDYELSYNLLGQPEARFSMGHEALGIWMTEELGKDVQKLSVLLDNIEQLQLGQSREFVVPGKEYQLLMFSDGIQVCAHALMGQQQELIPEEVELDDSLSFAECGLEDFKLALLSWQSFFHLE